MTVTRPGLLISLRRRTALHKVIAVDRFIVGACRIDAAGVMIGEVDIGALWNQRAVRGRGPAVAPIVS